MLREEEAGRPPARGGISAGGRLDVEGSVSNIALRVGSSASSSRPSASSSFSNSSMSTRNSEGALRTSGSSNNERSRNAKESDSDLLRRMDDQGRGSRTAPSAAKTYATHVCEADVSAFTIAAGVAEATADDTSYIPSADELTLSGDEFLTASPQSRSNSLDNERLSSDCRDKGSNRHLLTSSSSSSCSSYGSSRDSQSPSHPSSQKKASSSSGVASRLAMPDTDRSTAARNERNRDTNLGPNNSAARSNLCSDRSWRRGQGEEEEAAAGETDTPQAPLERLWRASASSFASALSGGLASAQFVGVQQPLRAAASASHDPLSADGATGDGAIRSSRSSTAQSSFSTVSSISCTTCSTSGGTSSHAKGGGGFLPSSCCYSFASSSSSCGGFAADEEGEEEVAARPAVVAAYDALDIAGALCGEGQGNGGETAGGERRRRPSRAQSSLDPPVLLAPHDGDDAYVFDETMDGQLFPEFLLSTSASEEQLLQPSSVRGGGGGFAAGVGRSGGSYTGGRDPLRERERREARERQTLLLARQVVGRFRAVHGTAAAADAVQLLQRYFHASRRHVRDTRSLERLAAACCYISARQKGVDSTSLFCLNDLAAELQPLTSSNGRRSRGSAAAPEEEQQQEPPQLDLSEARRRGELSASPERGRGRLGGDGEAQQQGAGEMQQQQVVDGRQRETRRQLAQRQQQQHEAAQWAVAAEERPRATTHKGGSLPKCSARPDEGSRLRASVCSPDAEEQVGVGASSSLFSGTPATFHGESALSSAATSATESLFCPPSSSSLDRTAAAAGVGGSPAAAEISQQSSKSQQTAHARCRTLARWIARVCRRLQLQQLPKAEPDMLLRCNALLRRVRQLVEQRLEEQEERTEERRAALVAVQQEVQQQLQDRPGAQQRQPAPREGWRKGLNEGPSPAEGADEETRHKEWGGSGETGRSRGATRCSGFLQLDETRRKKQSGDRRTSDEVDEDMDLLLLQSVLAEGADVFAAGRVPGTGRQTPAPPAPADVPAALLFADGSRATAAETGEEKQARRKEKETEGDCSRTGEREKDLVATDTKRRHSTVSPPQGEQQKSKRSREADKFHRLLCLEVSSEVRQRKSATHSSSSGSPQGERGYDLAHPESREAVGGSSSGDEPTAGPTGDALARENDGGRQRAAATRAAPLLHGQRAGGAARAAADASFPQAALLSRGDSWNGAAAAATQEDRSSSARTYTTSESDALLRETAEEVSAFADQGKGNSRVARNDLPRSGVDNSSKRCEYPPPGSSSSAAAAGGSVSWGEDRARAAGETAAATADAMQAAAAAASLVSPAAAPIRSATGSRTAAAASREGLERALAFSDRGRGCAGDDDDAALVTLLETLGKGLGGSRGASAAEEDARDSSGGEERDSHDKRLLKVIPESSRAAAAGAASGGPSPQHLQRVLQLHMKKSVWQQQCHLHALEKLKKDREKVFRGLVLMHRVLTAVYNRSLASAGSRNSSSGSGAANRTAAAAAGGTRSDEHGWSSGRSEDPLDGAWRARGRSDAVCMASLIILVFQWVQVVVPQRVVIDALHVDRKSVYTRRMEHMRILRALFRSDVPRLAREEEEEATEGRVKLRRRLKKPEAVARVDDEEDLAARFCEVLDSPALSRQLLEVAEEGLCTSELLLILRRDPLSSLYAAPQQQQQGQQRERGEPQQSAQRQPLDDPQQQQQRSWRQPHDLGGGQQQRGSGVSADAAAFLAAAESRPMKESAANRAASFAAIARAAVAAMAGAAKDGARRRSGGGDCLARGGESKSSASASGGTTQASHALEGVGGGGDEFLATKRARRDFCYDPSSSAASAATASAPDGLGAADVGKAAGTACRPCGRVDEEAEAAAAYRRAAAAGRAPLHRGEEERERRGTATTASSEGWALSRACLSAAGADAEEGHAGRRGHLGAQRGSIGSPSAARKTESRGETDTSLAAARYVGVRDGTEAAAYYGGAGGGAEGGGPADGGGGSGTGILGPEELAARGGGRRTKARSRGSHPHTLPSTEQLKLAKTAVLQSLPPAANVVSLQFERTQQRWVCKWLQSAGEGRAAGWKRRCFSVLKYGYDGAHQLAAAAATKLRDGRQRLQQLQQQQGKPVSNKCRRAAPPAAAAAAAPPPSPARAATS